MVIGLPQEPNLESYQHAPITKDRNIRLMRLYPASKGHSLQCKLIEVGLDDPARPKYRALSYVWGPNDPKYHILCDGKPLRITPNCESALLRLRHRKAPQHWWVDAICIDQTSERERGSQIQLMDRIYGQASETAAWLGPGNDSTKICMRLIGLVGALHVMLDDKSRSRNIRKFDIFLGQILRSFEKHHAKSKSASMEECLYELIYCEYFQRMWTVQEVALSQNCFVYCQNSKVAWKRFGLAASDLYNAYVDISERSWPTRGFFIHWGIWTHIQNYDGKFDYDQDIPRESLNILLSTILGQKASDNRDKVFALHGIFTTLQFSLPTPDYTQSFHQAYSEWTISFIRQTQSLQSFDRVYGEHRSSELPSWVPDFSSPKPYFPTVWSKHQYQASKQSKACPSYLNDWASIKLRGKVVGVIHSRGIPMREHIPRKPPSHQQASSQTIDTYFGITRVLQQWIQYAVPTCIHTDNDTIAHPLFQALDALGPPEPLHSKNILERELWFRSMVGQSPGSRGKLNSLKGLHSDSHAPSSDADAFPDPAAQDPTLEILEQICSFQKPDVLDYHVLLGHRAHSHVLFKTSNNLLGIAVHTIRPSDIVALLQGGAMAYVLRPVGDSYNLVAPAFIYGLMEGEEWPENEDELVDITLI